MLYGVRIKNKCHSQFDDKILLFKNKDKAVQFEKDIRFLDDVVYKEDYRNKVKQIKSKYSSLFVNDNIENEIELINQYPILVEFFN